MACLSKQWPTTSWQQYDLGSDMVATRPPARIISILLASVVATSLQSPQAGGEEVLVVTGGFSPQGHLSSLEVVGARCSPPPLPRPRSGHASFLSSDGDLLTCGGTTGRGAVPDLGCLVLSDMSWSRHSLLPQARIHSTLVTLAWGTLLLGGWGHQTSSLLLPRSAPLPLLHPAQERVSLGAGPCTARPRSPLLLCRGQSGGRTPAAGRDLRATAGHGLLWRPLPQVVEYRPGAGDWRQWPGLREGRSSAPALLVLPPPTGGAMAAPWWAV